MQVKIEVNVEIMEALIEAAERDPSLFWVPDLYALQDTLRAAVIKESARRNNRALMLGVKI